MPSENYPIITDAEDYFRQNEKRLMHQERRPQVQKASDLLGPGVAPFAVQIENWKVPEAAFNGFFFTAPGDTDAPDTTHWWIGQTTATSDGFGMQRVFTFHDSAYLPGKTAVRQFYDPGNGNLNYSTWQSQHHIGVDDSVSSEGTNGGIGAWSLNGDGTFVLPGVTSQPTMRRTRSSSQQHPDATFDTVRQWQTVNTDDGSWTYDNSTGLFTLVNDPGRWYCHCVVKVNAGDASAPYVARSKFRRGGSNDVVYGGSYNWDAGSDTFVVVAGLVSMIVAQTLEVQIFINGDDGGDIQTLAGSDSQIVFTRLGG